MRLDVNMNNKWTTQPVTRMTDKIDHHERTVGCENGISHSTTSLFRYHTNIRASVTYM